MTSAIRRSTTTTLACLGLAAALLPAAASAACPPVGTTTFYGSCAPRERCEKRVVNGHIRYFNTRDTHIIYHHYHRTNYGWVSDGVTYGSCRW
jgi:hypothetical protein